MSITSEEREFFIALGERIARLRKEHGITQTQLEKKAKKRGQIYFLAKQINPSPFYDRSRRRQP
ncbi:hypothetical protein ACX3YC_16400 [Pseudomonas mohnii]